VESRYGLSRWAMWAHGLRWRTPAVFGARRLRSRAAIDVAKMGAAAACGDAREHPMRRYQDMHQRPPTLAHFLLELAWLTGMGLVVLAVTYVLSRCVRWGGGRKAEDGRGDRDVGLGKRLKRTSNDVAAVEPSLCLGTPLPVAFGAGLAPRCIVRPMAARSRSP
jgi:hypothetical protein